MEVVMQWQLQWQWQWQWQCNGNGIVTAVEMAMDMEGFGNLFLTMWIRFGPLELECNFINAEYDAASCR